VHKKSDVLAGATLGAIGGAAGWGLSRLLQRGMTVAKRMVWKHMTPEQKARYLLKKIFPGGSR